jgi:branched-chain amino acid transport system substrate-binding protein
VLLRAAVLARRHRPAGGLIRRLALLVLLLVLAGCGQERAAITAGGRVAGDNLTLYSSVPRPARGLGRDLADATKLAISKAGGRAGDFGINFVSVDEGSLGRPDPRRVPAMAAEQAIRDAQVIAVVGSLRSDATMTTLPLFNAAGILLVSPGAGYPGFTKPIAAGEPDHWYPSGRPTFARLIGDDEAMAGALLDAAGDGPVAIEAEAGKVAEAQLEAVRAAGAEIVEDPARADAVIYLGGDVQAAAGVAESLAREAPDARLVFCDELTRAGLPGRLDAAALRRAVFVSAAPEPGSTEELRSFEDAFQAAFDRRPNPYAVLAFEGTRGVLEAIAGAGDQGRLRRVVAERYLELPPPGEAFTVFRVRDGERVYLSSKNSVSP